MNTEIVKEIRLSQNNELFLIVEGSGSSSYQYIYREAKGVYWDVNLKAFKSTPITDWSIFEWVNHIRNLVHECLGLNLIFSKNLNFINIPKNQQLIIQDKFDII
jgi:hypothetical protein